MVVRALRIAYDWADICRRRFPCRFPEPRQADGCSWPWQHTPWSWPLLVHPTPILSMGCLKRQRGLPTLEVPPSSFRCADTSWSILSILSSDNIYKDRLSISDQLWTGRELTSQIIRSNCERLPSNAFLRSGKFLTILRRFSICKTRCEAGFELVVARTSEEASWVYHQVSANRGQVQTVPQQSTCRSPSCWGSSMHREHMWIDPRRW